LKPAELQASLAASASKYLSDSNDPTAEFERRIKVANLVLKEKDIDTKKEIANLQVVAARQK
jgi:predicted RNA-binding protein